MSKSLEMISSCRSRLLATAFMLCSFAVSHAQEVPEVKVRFVSFPKLDNPLPVELVIGENQGVKETIPVELPTNVISEVYTIKKPAAWMLGKKATDDKGQPTFNVYGTAPILAAKEQLVMVVRKGKTDAEGFTLIAFDDQQTNFGGGKYLFFNAAKVDIACKIGDKNVVIKPMSHQLIGPKPDVAEDGKGLLFVSLYFRKDNEAHPFFSSNWRYNEKARTIVILYHDENNRSIRLHTIRE